MTLTSYPSDLSDGAWKILEARLYELIPAYSRRTNLRRVVDALAYRLRTGCQWRYLPHDFPAWQTVYRYFAQWSRRLILDELNLLIVRLSRRSDTYPDGSPRSAAPTALVADSQSVKSTVRGRRDDRGFDGNKRINGIKRHALTDTAGRVVACVITPANAHDGPILRELLIRARLDGYAVGCAVFADDAYRGQAGEARIEGYDLRIVKRSDYVRAKGLSGRAFAPLPKRWVVEQAFGCLSQWRGVRLSHERSSWHAETLFLLANALRWLRHLNP